MSGSTPNSVSRPSALPPVLISKPEQLQTIRNAGNPIATPPKAITWLEKQFSLMGWLGSLPNNREARTQYLADIYHLLTDQNDMSPREIPFNFILPRFFDALVKNRAKPAGNQPTYPNAHSLYCAYEAWINQSRTAVRQAWAAYDGGTYDDPSQLHAAYQQPNGLQISPVTRDLQKSA